MKYLYLNLIVFFSLGFLFTDNVYAQEPNKSFDSIYVHAATTLAANDINKAIHVGDSLYNNSQDSFQKMKSLMLIATLKGRKGEKAEALSYAIQAEEIAQKEKNHEWQIRIAGFLSTTFREVNLTEEGESYLGIAERAINEIKKDSPSVTLIQAFIHQEKAYYRIANEDYKAAIVELRNAEALILQTPEKGRNKIFLATNLQMLGTCLIGLKEYDSAYEKLTLALNELGEEESELKAFIYTEFAEIELNNKNYDAAYEWFKKAEIYVETSDNFNIKSSLYQGLSSYYKAIGNHTEAIRYNELYTGYVKSFSSSTKHISEKLINQLRLGKEEMSRKNFLLIGISLFLMASVITLILYFRDFQRKQRIKYEKIITKIKEFGSSVEESQGSVNQPRGARETLIMPKETEDRIITELNKMEGDAFFLQKDISLSSLATSLQTNPKYLSYVINTHKGKDFNNYINELRVEFVIEKLQNDPDYLNYKISYIAEECGFSSHSKFAAVFKNITELSPSAFISHLKKDILEEV